MKYRPLLLRQPHADEMVRAFLDGRKTQFRVPVKPQPPSESTLTRMQDGFTGGIRPVFGLSDEPNAFSAKSPFGTIGDRLWLKEAFYWDEGSDKTIEQVAYKASTEMPAEVKAMGCRWTPSIHMPRWASRIDLEITRVRVERVQDITEEDARKEGVVESECGRNASRALFTYKRQCVAPSVLQFADIWQSIYGTWDANPRVFAYTVKRIKP